MERGTFTRSLLPEQLHNENVSRYVMRFLSFLLAALHSTLLIVTSASARRRGGTSSFPEREQITLNHMVAHGEISNITDPRLRHAGIRAVLEFLSTSTWRKFPIRIS